MDRPAIKNSWTRVAMRRVRSFQSEDRHRVLDAISRTTQNAVARTRSDDWLAVELVIEVFDAIANAIGAKRAVDFWRDVVYDSWVGGLLEPLLANKDQDQIGLLALAPQAWALSARDCGEVVVVPDPSGRGGVRLEARELPPIVRDSLGIQTMYAGALKAMLAFSGLSAEVEIAAEGAGPLAFRLVFR